MNLYLGLRLHGLTQLAFQGAALLQHGVHLFAKHRKSAPPGGFCVIERDVGLSDKFFSLGAVLRGNGNADAHTDEDVVSINIEWMPDDCDDFLA